jgi:hypothetical protein
MVKFEIKGKGSLTDDELELLGADIQDAIDGVLEDWGI